MEDDYRDTYEYEVDLRDYIKVIWREKWIITLITAVSLGAALAFSLSTSSTYRTEALLIISSPLSDQIVEEPGSTDNPISFNSGFEPDEVGLSDELLSSVIEKTDLRRSGMLASPERLRSNISIDRVEQEESGATDQKPVYTVSITGNNQEQLTEVANTWTELYVKRASSLATEEIERYRKLVSAEYSSVKSRLETKIEQRIDARDEHGPEVLKIETRVLEDKYEKYYSSLESAKLELEKNKAKLSKISSALEEEPRYLSVERVIPPGLFGHYLASPVDEPEGESTGEREVTPEGLKVKSRTTNEVFLGLSEKSLEVETQVASLKKQVEYLSARLEEYKTQIHQKRSRVERTETKLDELNKEITSLKNRADSLYSTREMERKASNDKPPIKGFDKADSTMTINKVNTGQNLVVASVLGLFVGVLVAFFKHYMKGYEL